MSGPITPPLTVTTVGGTPSGRPITTIKVSDGDLTISGNVATIDTSGSAATPGGSDTQVQYNNSGAFGGSADFTFTGIGGSSPTFTITNSASDTATLTQGLLTLDGGTGGSAHIRSSTGDTGLLLTAAEEALTGPYMLLDINTNPSQLLLKNGEEDGTIVIETDSGTGDITVNANGDLNLWGDSNSVNIRHQSGGAVDVVSATDTPAVLQVKTVGDGVPSINLLDDTRAITLKCDANQKLKLEGGVNTFVFDASSATGGITWPDGTTQITAASGGTPAGSDKEVQFNDSGSFGAESQFIWDSANDTLQLGQGIGYPRLALAGNNGYVYFKNNSTPTPVTQASVGVNGTTFYIKTFPTDTERLRITTNGEWGIEGANYGTDGQVLTSGGAGSSVSWEDAGGGGSSSFPLPLGGFDATYKYLNIGTAAPYGVNTSTVPASEGDYALNTRPRAFPFIAPASAAPVSIYVVQNTTGTGTATVGIYSTNSDNYPDTLVATGTYDPTSSGNKTITNTLSTALVAGEMYYFCVRCDNNGGNLDAIGKEYIPSIFPSWRINENDYNTCLTMNNITSGTALLTTAAFGSGNPSDIDRPQMWLEF